MRVLCAAEHPDLLPAPERFDERLREMEQAMLKAMYGLDVPEDREEELDAEMPRAWRESVGMR